MHFADALQVHKNMLPGGPGRAPPPHCTRAGMAGDDDMRTYVMRTLAWGCRRVATAAAASQNDADNEPAERERASARMTRSGAPETPECCWSSAAYVYARAQHVAAAECIADA